MPGVQIDRSRSLSHAQLIHSHSGVVYQLNPADDAACRTFKAADGASGGAYLSKVQPHTAPEFADLGKIIHTAVNSIQAVRHRVNEAAGKLMVRLTRIGEGGSCHSHLHTAEAVIEFPDPDKPVLFFLHCQVERDAKEHFLGRFQKNMVLRADAVPLEEQIQTCVGEQLIPAVIQKQRRFLNFLPAVLF